MRATAGVALTTSPNKFTPTESRANHADPDFRFLRDIAGRHSRVHRAGVLLAALHPLHRGHPGLRDPAPHGRRPRQLSAAGGAVLHPRRQPDELGRHHQPHLRFRGGDLRLDARRARACEHLRLGDLRRHVRHRDCGRRRSRHHRDQGDEGPRLQHRICGRRHRGLGDARPDHPAVAAVRDLRHDGQRLDRRAVPRRLYPGRRHDHLHDAVRHLLRAALRHGPRPDLSLERRWSALLSRRCRR